LIEFISNKLEKIVDLLERFFRKIPLDKWLLGLASIGLFLHWVKYPLSGGINSFNLYSPILISWGLLFLIVAISAIIRNRWFLLFPLLVIVLYFPLQIHWDYVFIQDIISEITQKGKIQQFAEGHVYEPNIVNPPEDLKPSDTSDLWNDPWSRIILAIESLGIGFWIAFIGIIIISRKLGRKKFIIALLCSLALSLPGMLTASFLTLGRNAFLKGDYVKSLDRYKFAMEINQFVGKRTLKEAEFYYLWIGESLFHMGVKNAPEVYFFLGKNLEEADSFIKSKEMYQKSLSLPPARKALAGAMVAEAKNDFNQKRFGSAMESLEEAFRLDRNQFEALFYMTYISFILKDKQSSLYYSSQLFDICKERTLISDVYNILGDMYHRAEKFADSRDMYRKSIKAFDRKKNGNYHAWVGLAGW